MNEPLVVEALDAAGAPLVGHEVNFVVTQGGGSVFAGSAETNASGIAYEWWRMGAAGPQTVEARATDPATGAKLVFGTLTATSLERVTPEITYYSFPSVGGTGDVFVVGVDGVAPANLTNSDDGDFESAWSPDGMKIAWARCPSGGALCRISVMDADGSNLVDVTAASFETHTVWSPDGSKIAYRCNPSHCVMNSDGSGAEVTLSTPNGGATEIYVMDANGNNQMNVSNSPSDDDYPSWSAPNVVDADGPTNR